ncbi:MAG: winged helix-turn-helix domain-containing protein, partial [Actinomycetota bacterium]
MGERSRISSDAPAASAAHSAEPSAAATYDSGMRFGVLGSLSAVARVGAGGPPAHEPRLGGPKQRLVLALLLAEPNRLVPVDRLVQGVWGDAPPGSARHTLQAYISELRKEVGESIQRSGAGYVFEADAQSLDSLEFEERISAVRADRSAAPESVAERLEAALARGRGDAVCDVRDQDARQGERARRDELRLGAG